MQTGVHVHTVQTEHVAKTGITQSRMQAGVRVHTVQRDHVAETGITQSRVQAGVRVHTVQRDHVAETGHYTVTCASWCTCAYSTDRARS